MVTDISQLDMNGTYSYADYLMWQFKERVELFKGKVWKMSPAPRTSHQRISRNFNGIFYNHLFSNNCEFFSAPFDVSLYNKTKSTKQNKEVFTVVQPDLCIICDETKITELGCNGAPDLIIEILSPGNSKKEMRIKYDLYEKAAVREYWVADPERETVQVFTLNKENKYYSVKIYISDDTMVSHIFPELKVNLLDVF